MSIQARKPAGTPVGGQFAATSHPSGDVTLWSPELTATHDRLRRLSSDLEVNGADTSALHSALAPLGRDVALTVATNLVYAHRAFAALDAEYSDWTEDHEQDDAVQAVDYSAFADENDPDFAVYHETVAGEYRSRYDALLIDASRALAGECDAFASEPLGADLPQVSYQRQLGALAA